MSEVPEDPKLPEIGPLGEPGKRKEYFEKIANELEEFLLDLQANPADLVAFVDDRVGFLNDPRFEDIDDQAKAILIQSDYSIVHAIMSYRKSTAVRWVCVWVI